jgi:hypothetical protein
MRAIRLCVALAACLAVAGCIGGQRASVSQSASASPVVVVDKIVPSSPTPETVSAIGLLKAAPTTTPNSTPAANETVVAGTQQSPLSCVDQHLKDIQSGKIQPTGACQ